MTRRKAAPLVGRARRTRGTRLSDALGRRVGLGLALDRRLAGEREQAGGGFEFVGIGCRELRLHVRFGRCGLDEDLGHRLEKHERLSSRLGFDNRIGLDNRVGLDDRLEQHEGLGRSEDGVGKGGGHRAELRLRAGGR